MMPKSEDAMLVVRLPAKLKSGLKREAERDHRTLSSLVLKVLSDWAATQKKASRR